MNLLKIKKRCDEIDISIRSLSAKIEMSEQNLHKCIRDSRIEAGVLEKIAKVLDVPISYFFDEVEPVHNAKDSEIVEIQRKYISLLEKRLEEHEGKETRQVG
jgi:transcriptional regulator with XRE-family HTH domain